MVNAKADDNGVERVVRERQSFRVSYPERQRRLTCRRPSRGSASALDKLRIYGVPERLSTGCDAAFRRPAPFWDRMTAQLVP